MNWGLISSSLTEMDDTRPFTSLPITGVPVSLITNCTLSNSCLILNFQPYIRVYYNQIGKAKVYFLLNVGPL